MTKWEQPAQKISILGVGLIGGSLGMALKSTNATITVMGYDIHKDSLILGQNLGALDSWTTDLPEAVKDADIVFLCTPVDLFPSLIKELAPLLKPGVIITDTGSTKSKIIGEILPLLPDQVEFLGGHPMAGSEKAGIDAADRFLFENALYVLTPHKNNSDAALGKISALAEAIGAKVVIMDADEHDLIVAAVSHVPHLTAASLISTLVDLSHEHPFAPMLAAGGFRDTTRIAAGNPELWQQICFSNNKRIGEILDLLIAKLKTAADLIQEDNRKGLYEFLAEAREQRLKIPSGLRGLLSPLYEIVITVPDKPGVIAFISTLLGDNGVNIIDIEILRVREGQGGTIRLGFQSELERNKAENLLTNNKVVVRRL